MRATASPPWCLAILFAAVRGNPVDPQNVPPPDSFLRRAFSSAAIVGDFIYFDGGEVSMKHTLRKSDPVNATIAVDLTQSWHAENVSMIETPHDPKMQALSRQAILVDEQAGGFYVWGGRTSYEQKIKANPGFWKFIPTGKGKGKWINERDNLSNKGEPFFQLERVQGGADVTTPTGAFVLGGYSGHDTTPEHLEATVDGYVSFDPAAREWTHNASSSAMDYSADGTVWGGEAVFAPNMGPNGLVVLLGGMSGHSETDSGSGEYLDFGTVHFMDPITRKWYSQATSGSPPSPRYFHCATGVQNVRAGFDIFVFGGGNDKPPRDFSDMFVLSLPGFHWTEVVLPPDPGRSRRDHTCATVGKRQLISWGGLNYDNGTEWETSDPFPQGVGVFDMQAWEWTHRYDASADHYQRNPAVKKWYEEGGMKKMEWGDGVGELLGLLDVSSSVNGQGESRSKPRRIGMIVGIVVGALGALSLGALTWWLLMRKRRQARVTAVKAEAAAAVEASSGEINMYRPHKPELDAVTTMQTPTTPSELGSINDTLGEPVELDGTGRRGR